MLLLLSFLLLLVAVSIPNVDVVFVADVVAVGAVVAVVAVEGMVLMHLLMRLGSGLLFELHQTFINSFAYAKYSSKFLPCCCLCRCCCCCCFVVVVVVVAFLFVLVRVVKGNQV